MKFPIFAAAAAILTGIHAQESCSVCPGGINVDADTETENGYTCGNIQSDAARFDADDDICDRIKGFEELCCGGTTESTASVLETTEAVDATTETPESDTTCSVCPNGITVDADTETEGNNVCGTITADAARFEADDNTCGRIKAFESTCCPDVPTTVAAISTETGSTTSAAVTSSSTAEAVVISTAAAVVSSTVVVAPAEVVLTTAVSGSSCVVCPGGITAPLTVPTVAGKTCADLLPDAAEHENGDALCDIIKQSEDICCPVGGFVGCSVCAGGLTVSGATLILGDMTCDDIMMDAADVPESSDVCAQAKGFEDTCCPAIIMPTTSTEVTTTAATDATTVSAADASSSTTVASVSTTTASFDFDLTTTNSTEVTATAAANTIAVSAAEATSSTIAASVSSTTASFDFDLNMTNSPTKAPTPADITMPPIGNENLASSNTITEFNEVYDPSTGFSVSVKPGSTLASIVIVCVMFAKLS